MLQEVLKLYFIYGIVKLIIFSVFRFHAIESHYKDIFIFIKINNSNMFLKMNYIYYIFNLISI